MKVKDLIKELQEANQEAEVTFSIYEGCCGDREYLEVVDTDFDECLQYNSKSELVPSKYFPNGRFEVVFDALDFMTSCRSAGTARDAVKKMREENEKWRKEQQKKSKN